MLSQHYKQKNKEHVPPQKNHKTSELKSFFSEMVAGHARSSPQMTSISHEGPAQGFQAGRMSFLATGDMDLGFS